MADKTKIEWSDATWNPITGCSVISPGCTNCYAMKLAGTRMKNEPSRAGLTTPSKAGPVWNGQVRFNEQWLTQPLQWSKPRMVFVCAHADLFHESVPDEWIEKIFAVMALAPQHTFQVLTKRPERMREYLMGHETHYRITSKAGRMALSMNMAIDYPLKVTHSPSRKYPKGIEINLSNWPQPNVWLGVSVEDQRRAEERIPILLDTRAAVRWVSAEPLLGSIDLRQINQPNGGFGPYWIDALSPGTMGWFSDEAATKPMEADPLGFSALPALDWVVVGGESGPNARPMHPDWARSLRDQCAAAGVPLLFKQWGEFGPAFGSDLMPTGLPWSGLDQRAVANGTATAEQACRKLGKRKSGRLLDGVEHNGFPECRT
ncbi:protein gp37 [Agrobacterium vitis]|nr:protein gp37 [Agrobacterium vitis]MBE1437044.1 protein gp37 [Agrobacterium vitis]